MAINLDKYKNKLKNKLKEIKIISGIRTQDLIVVILIVIASWIIGAYIGTGIFNLRNGRGQENKAVPHPVQKSELNPENSIESRITLVDKTSWKNYRSQKYEFEIKYPKEWTAPKEENLFNSESGYEYKISFNSFNILIRNNSKSSAIPKPDNNNSDTPKYVLASYQSDYAKLNNYPAENASCATREIHILKDKFYFKKVFVYHVIKGKYAYDVVPAEEIKNDSSNYISTLALQNTSPELDDVLSTFKFKPSDPVISRPRIVYAVRISCAEKNDHPSNSDTKGKHMDEDCCPDPDEWPKPGCSYSASGRALMISSPRK